MAERIKVSLAKVKEFNSKPVYKATVGGSKDGASVPIEVLSTNWVDGKCVVRIEKTGELNGAKLGFNIQGLRPDEVQASRVGENGVYEFSITPISIPSSEEDAYKERDRRLMIIPAQEGLSWKKRESEIGFELTEEDRVQADEDDLSVSIGECVRNSYPDQMKCDTVSVELFSPFVDTRNSQLQITSKFLYARNGSSELKDANSKKVITLEPGYVENTNTPLSITDNVFFGSGDFELVLTVEDLRTKRKVETVIPGASFGPAVPVTAEKS